MSFEISSKDYMKYIRCVAASLDQKAEYITNLDAATGDGDHWVNLHMGFEKLQENDKTLSCMPISECFINIGMLMTNTIGGSSGILYGGAYIAAGKMMNKLVTMDCDTLIQALEVMVQDMMSRGEARPGDKTMIDALYPAVLAGKDAVSRGVDDCNILVAMKKAAEEGAELTRFMEARRGRACYQSHKGVGYLDPGAITMAMQISCLVDYITENELT